MVTLSSTSSGTSPSRVGFDQPTPQTTPERAEPVEGRQVWRGGAVAPAEPPPGKGAEVPHLPSLAEHEGPGVPPPLSADVGRCEEPDEPLRGSLLDPASLRELAEGLAAPDETRDSVVNN